MQVDALVEPPPPLAAIVEIPLPCDRSGELLSEQQRLSKEGQKKIREVRGMVAIVISADGDVVSAKAISASFPRDGNEAATVVS